MRKRSKIRTLQIRYHILAEYSTEYCGHLLIFFNKFCLKTGNKSGFDGLSLFADAEPGENFVQQIRFYRFAYNPAAFQQRHPQIC